MTRTPLVVHGLEHVSEGQACVVVANHASYLDTAFIVTALPIELIFVAKQEFMNNFFYRLFMIRLRTEFVERFDKQKSVERARRLAQLVRSSNVSATRAGSSVLFFPAAAWSGRSRRECADPAGWL